MYSIAPDEALAAGGLWAAFAALRLLQDAEDQLTLAETVASGMVADSTWHSEGVSARALRDALAQLHRGLTAEVVAVQEQQGVVRAAVR
ncbi:hypothetical protein [Microbacterium alcoholitolerans]|uniref:hypothetical protein n=1 Tax=unclassified Microbacterium TaxID=2609290 RepID=UPI003D16A7AD